MLRKTIKQEYLLSQRWINIWVDILQKNTI